MIYKPTVLNISSTAETKTKQDKTKQNKCLWFCKENSPYGGGITECIYVLVEDLRLFPRTGAIL